MTSSQFMIPLPEMPNAEHEQQQEQEQPKQISEQEEMMLQISAERKSGLSKTQVNFKDMPNYVRLISQLPSFFTTQNPGMQQVAQRIRSRNYMTVVQEDGLLKIQCPFVAFVPIDLDTSESTNSTPTAANNKAKFTKHYMPLLIHHLAFENGSMKKTPMKIISESPHLVQIAGYELLYNTPELDVTIRAPSALTAFSTMKRNSGFQPKNWFVLVPGLEGTMPVFKSFYTYIKELNMLGERQTIKSIAPYLKASPLGSLRPSTMPQQLELERLPKKAQLAECKRRPTGQHKKRREAKQKKQQQELQLPLPLPQQAESNLVDYFNAAQQQNNNNGELILSLDSEQLGEEQVIFIDGLPMVAPDPGLEVDPKYTFCLPNFD